MDWLASFTNENFMPHGHCYLWRPDILWMHVISDIVTALSYYVIPVVLGLFLLKRRDAPFPGLIGLFVVFILLCGTTHLVSVFTTWIPAYELQGWVKAATASVSLLTAITLAPKLPMLIAATGLQEAFNKMKQENGTLTERATTAERLYDASLTRETQIVKLKKEVDELLKAQGLKPRYTIDETGVNPT